MSVGWALAAVAAASVGVSLGQAVPPPQEPPIIVVGPDADIVVTGPRPVMRGGLWEFHRVGPGGPGTRPFHFTTCLPGGELESALRNLAGERSMLPRRRHCGNWRMTVGAGRIAGNRTCMESFAQIGKEPQKSRMRLSGQYDARHLTVMVFSDDQYNGLERGGGSGWNPARPTYQDWRIDAARVADCPLERRRDQRTLDEAIFRLFDPGGNDD